AQNGVAEDDRGAGHAHRVEAELGDELPNRIGAEVRVVVDLGDAGLVGDRRRLEPLGDDLAAEPWTRFEERRLTQVRTVFLKEMGGKQSTGTAADDGNTRHEINVSVQRGCS